MSNIKDAVLSMIKKGKMKEKSNGELPTELTDAQTIAEQQKLIHTLMGTLDQKDAAIETLMDSLKSKVDEINRRNVTIAILRSKIKDKNNEVEILAPQELFEELPSTLLDTQHLSEKAIIDDLELYTETYMSRFTFLNDKLVELIARGAVSYVDKVKLTGVGVPDVYIDLSELFTTISNVPYSSYFPDPEKYNLVRITSKHGDHDIHLAALFASVEVEDAFLEKTRFYFGTEKQ